MGLTLDTGALIALSRRKGKMPKVFRAALDAKQSIRVPTAVIAEWWRVQDSFNAELLNACEIVGLTRELATAAGEALADIGGGGPSTIDAIVMVVAARLGDVVYTSDPDDLLRFKDRFRGVRVIALNDV